jgi:glucokinase
MSYLLGLDLGGTSVKGVAVSTDGETLARFHEPFELSQPMAFAAAVSRTLDRATDAHGSPLRVGLSAPGIAARDGSCISFMPGRFEGLEGLIWGERLGRPEGVPVLNDAHAALLGEVWLGAAQNAQDAILLTLGTGVGGAVLANGSLLLGHGGKAGHLGHISLNPDGPADICQTPGSLEDAIGNNNIRERSGARFQTTHELIAAHEQGDHHATEIWGRSVKSLAAAIASLGNVLDPEMVILGGGIARSGRTLLDPLESFLDAMEWRPGGRRLRLVLAMLGDLAGAYGAAHNALIRTNPSTIQNAVSRV